MLTQERLKELFDYDADAGLLVWKEPGHGRTVGRHVTGWLHKPSGRCVVTVLRKKYKRARLVYAWHYGWPDNDVDHINGDRTDDRIENLRPATRAQNLANVGALSTNKLGIRGVSLHKHSGLYRANIRINGKQTSVGYFRCKHEAGRAYERAAEELYGEYAYHRRKSR